MKILFAFYEPIPEWADLSSEFEGLEIAFARDLEAISNKIADTDALFILAPRYTADVAAIVKDKAQKLRWIQATTVGVDEIVHNGIPLGTIVTKAVGIFDANVAEQAMALVLALTRKVAAAERDGQKHQYNREKHWKKVMSLERKNVGIMGYGGIGKQVGKRVKAFNARILVYDVSKGIADSYADRFFGPEQFNDFLGQCDIVILSLPLTSENIYMFDTETFKKMKRNSILINVARGKLVKESALIQALHEGIIGGAGLDVFEEEPLSPASELWDMENVVITPHLGGQGDYKEQMLADLFRNNIKRFLQGEELMHVVDLVKGF